MKHNHATLLTTTNRYLTINYLLAGIIICVFIYSGFFYTHFHNYTLPSSYTEITGSDSPSTGLTRSFLQLLKGNKDVALELNPYSVQLFTFFVSQFFLRILISLLLIKTRLRPIIILVADSAISLTWFIIAFWPLLKFWVGLLQQLLRG